MEGWRIESEGLRRRLAEAGRQLESERKAGAHRLEVAKEGAQELIEDVVGLVGEGAEAMKERLGPLKEYVQQLKAWAEHGRALEEMRQANEEELVGLREAAERLRDVEAHVAALKGREGGAGPAELQRALAVSTCERQALERRLRAVEAREGKGAAEARPLSLRLAPFLLPLSPLSSRPFALCPPPPPPPFLVSSPSPRQTVSSLP